MIEQRLDFSRWVENGFGTGDCVIVADEILQIIDYKHGLGILVSAGDEEHGGNSQMMCYASVSYTHLDVYKRQDIPLVLVPLPLGITPKQCLHLIFQLLTLCTTSHNT